MNYKQINKVEEELEEEEEEEKQKNNNQQQEKIEEENLSCFLIIYNILKRAIPMAMTFALGNIANFITLYFAGHIKNYQTKDENINETDIFAGISMSLLFSNISCLSILVGMTGAVETLGLK